MEPKNNSQETEFDSFSSFGDVTVQIVKSNLPLCFEKLPSSVAQSVYRKFSNADRFCSLKKMHDFALGRWATENLIYSRFGQNVNWQVHNESNEKYFGFPYLVDSNRRLSHFLSITHSGDCAAAAISEEMSVGIDLERQCERTSTFLKILMNDYESAQYESKLKKIHSLWTYYWTAKEAISKVLQQGLRLSLQNIEVQIEPSKENPETANVGSATFHSSETPHCHFHLRFHHLKHKDESYILCIAIPKSNSDDIGHGPIRS